MIRKPCPSPNNMIDDQEKRLGQLSDELDTIIESIKISAASINLWMVESHKLMLATDMCPVAKRSKLMHAANRLNFEQSVLNDLHAKLKASYQEFNKITGLSIDML